MICLYYLPRGKFLVSIAINIIQWFLFKDDQQIHFYGNHRKLLHESKELKLVSENIQEAKLFIHVRNTDDSLTINSNLHSLSQHTFNNYIRFVLAFLINKRRGDIDKIAQYNFKGNIIFGLYINGLCILL